MSILCSAFANTHFILYLSSTIKIVVMSLYHKNYDFCKMAYKLQYTKSDKVLFLLKYGDYSANLEQLCAS
jgi:hypothetical protein